MKRDGKKEMEKKERRGNKENGYGALKQRDGEEKEIGVQLLFKHVY